uniref:Uncharacterized protein n=1 Tax=Ixodes ricinus TaxID=34613 RepID=A0A6B0U6T4_IXORI
MCRFPGCYASLLAPTLARRTKVVYCPYQASSVSTSPRQTKSKPASAVSHRRHGSRLGLGLGVGALLLQAEPRSRAANARR